MLFKQPVGAEVPLLVNAMPSRHAWRWTLTVAASEVSAELARRLGGAVELKRVTDGTGQEVVVTGTDVDLAVLPLYLQHEFNGAPYISAAMDVSKHRETGRMNTVVRRLMLRDPSETDVDLAGPTDGRIHQWRAMELGQRREVAFVAGLQPLDYIAATQLHGDGNELAFMGGIRGEPVQVVPCKTVGLGVPAHTELALEGSMEGDWDTPEGPFGEYDGCYGAAHLNTRNARRHLYGGDCASIPRRSGIGDQTGLPPQGTGLHHVRTSMKVRDKGDGRNALVAALCSKANVKRTIVVDDDIDVFSDQLVEWALSSRFQADEGLLCLNGMRTLQLDPSLARHHDKAGAPTTGAKMGFDAKRRLDRPCAVFDIARPPFTVEEGTRDQAHRTDIGDLVTDMRAAIDERRPFRGNRSPTPRHALGRHRPRTRATQGLGGGGLRGQRHESPDRRWLVSRPRLSVWHEPDGEPALWVSSYWMRLS